MKINILLPYKEKFDEEKASSVSITIKNNLFYTKYLNKIRVYGQNVKNPIFKDNFVGLNYSMLSFRSKNKFLAFKMLEIISKDTDKEQTLEIHNRPYLVDQISKKIKFPISLFLHNDPLTMKGSKSLKDRQNILNKCTYVFCVSEYVKSRFLRDIWSDREKVQVLYNGVNRNLKRFPRKKKEVLFVGRLVPEKGAHIYVEAIKSIASKHPDWIFGLIGSFRLGDNEKSNSYTNNVITNFESIGPQARFYGFQKHKFVEEKMKTASIIAVPSIWQEPFGLVVSEAMSNGICIVASKVGGIPEIIKNNGVLIHNINHRELAKEISFLIVDEVVRQSYQKKAWNNFNLSSKNSSQKLDDFRKIIFSNFY